MRFTHNKVAGTLMACSCTLLSLPSAHAELSITEFMAENDSVLVDEDGEFNDWIEIANSGDAPISTAGYYLTDEATLPAKWLLPDVSIQPGGFLVVFASGKDRSPVDGELHTNFSLLNSGEYLALIKPDNTAATEFSPAFPKQFSDISYGFGTGGALLQEKLLPNGSELTYLVPNADIGESWHSPDFDDASWTAARSAIGFGYSPPVSDAIGPNGDVRSSMGNVNASIYVRMPFELENPIAVVSLTLKTRFEDGFVAYLNGREIARRNAPNVLEFDSSATASGEVLADDPYELIPLEFAGDLVAGTNILSFQAMNNAAGSNDFFLDAELDAELLDLSAGIQKGYFEKPTPGAPNNTLKVGPPGPVQFSEATKGFTDDFSLTLSVETPGAEIRYTTDGSLPVDDPLNPSPLYSSPISIDATTQLRAKAFLSGALEGSIDTEGYIKLSADSATFTSDLPITLIEAFGANRQPYDTSSTDRRPMMMIIWEPKLQADGEIRSSMLNPPDLVTRMGVRKRGSSSGGWPKYNMSLEAWTDNDWVEKTIRPLGLGGEDDWILECRYEFDRALMRNQLIYGLSRDIGRYAARSRYIELFNNSANGNDVRYSNGAPSGDYFGVYTIMERLDRDDDRIDVDGLDATIDSEPDISGGYIFKNDRASPGDSTFAVAMGTSTRDLVNIYPSGRSNNRRPPGYPQFVWTSTQRNWLVGRLNATNKAVTTYPSGINSDTAVHFTDYMDVDSFIDHLWLNALMMNVDWGRLSAWMYLPRNGKLQGGPIWDFDRTSGCDSDGRASSPSGWNPSGDSRVWYDGQYPWFGHVLGFRSNTDNPSSALSQRPDQFQQAVDRWGELRDSQFSTEYINASIDGLAARIREAQARNFVRWAERSANGGQYSGGVPGWEGEVAHLKGWLQRRVDWIDEQFLQRPILTRNSGVVDPGFELVLSSTEGQVFFTTDGSDPRAPGGAPSTSATVFDGGPVDEVLLPEIVAPASYLVPSDDSLSLAWTQPDFDDTGWTAGLSGIGFESVGGDLEPGVTTDIRNGMLSVNASCYMRFEFDFDNRENINSLMLGMKYDDGFIAYLNGVEVARDRAPDEATWNSSATGARNDGLAIGSFVQFDLTANADAVINGRNVLAIHGMNANVGSNDFLCLPTISVNHTVAATPVPLNETTLITARTHNGMEWSAPSVATFVIGSEIASADNIVVSEFMYHPLEPNAGEIADGFTDQDDFEFIEIQNIGTTSVNVSNLQLSDGVEFSFQSGDFTELAPGQYALVVSNRAAFEKRYGPAIAARVAGEFVPGMNLNNGGERILLEATDGTVVKDFTYDDRSPWSELADGSGFSLVLRTPQTNPDHTIAANWLPSSTINGNPASSNSTGFVGDPGADEDGDGLTALVEYALGLDDTDRTKNGEVIQLLFVNIDDNDFVTVTFPLDPDATDVEVSVELSVDLETWANNPEALELLSSDPNESGQIIMSYRTTTPVSVFEKLYLRLNVSIQ
jgi:hypothetical protein